MKVGRILLGSKGKETLLCSGGKCSNTGTCYLW